LFKTCISKKEAVIDSSFAIQPVKFISVCTTYFSPIFGHHHVPHLKHLLYNHRLRFEVSRYKNI